MKKFLVILPIFLFIFFCGCTTVQHSNQPASDPDIQNTDASSIAREIMHAIEYYAKDAAIDDVTVYSFDKDGILKITVMVDPAITKYQLALNLEPIVAALAEKFTEYEIEHFCLEIAGRFYKNGDIYNIVSWTSSDFVNGEITSPMDGKIGSMSIEEFFQFCEYTAGEFEEFKSPSN